VFAKVTKKFFFTNFLQKENIDYNFIIFDDTISVSDLHEIK
jgi:hypothetical protein